MKNRFSRWQRDGFALVELLVVIAIIALHVSTLLPSLSAAKEAAKASTCGLHLRTFSTGFEIHANQDRGLARSSGVFDHKRDGDVREVDWVANTINLKVANSGKMLCPTNRRRISEKVADYANGATTGTDNPLRWGSNSGSALVPRPAVAASNSQPG